MKKTNIKLTLSLVSLFIALLFLILGNKLKVCLSFGFIFMAISMEMYALYKNEAMKKSIEAINEEMMADNFNVTFEKEYRKEKKKMTKQKNWVLAIFSICSLCLVILAITNFF